MATIDAAQPRSGIDYDAFLAHRDDGRRFTYTDKDTILYALGVGMGRDPLNLDELKFVYEGDGFVALPMLALVVARSPLARTLPINYAMVLHGEQSLTLHRPLPTAGTLIADTRITDILDKGANKGAILYSETVVREEGVEAPLFTTGMALFARGDGGFGGPSGPAPVQHRVPDRAPDHVHVTDTRADQALLYRLSGDRNPLHADPATARKAGFPRPILHGLCTYAIAGRAVLATACGYDPDGFASMDARFTAPVFPGDTIETDIWVDGAVASFRCRVPAREAVVLNNGRVRLKAKGEGR